MSIREYNGNRNKCLAGMGTGMGIGLKLTGIETIGKAESHSHTPLVDAFTEWPLSAGMLTRKSLQHKPSKANRSFQFSSGSPSSDFHAEMFFSDLLGALPI